MKKEYINVNANKLHNEFINAGIVPTLVQSQNDKTWITFTDDTDMQMVQQIIDAHDPTPLPQQQTEQEVLRDYILEVDYRLILLELGL